LEFAGQGSVKAASDPLSIVAEEKIRVVLSNNGGLEELEINGTIFLQVINSLHFDPMCTLELAFI